MIKLLSDDERGNLRDSFWNDFVSNEDLYRQNYCGYWMYGAEHFEWGWLAYEGELRVLNQHKAFANAVEKALVIVGQANAFNRLNTKIPLPKDFFVITKQTSDDAYRIGERLWGECWLSDGKTDSTRYDVVMQLAIFGEIKYG